MSNLPVHLKKAIEADVSLIDVIQGEIKNLMVEWQDKKFDLNKQDWADGYQDCLTDLYTLCYDVIFYQRDMERKNAN